MKRVLLIDSLNMFIRAYIMDPSLTMGGNPCGGIKGTLKILQKLVRETRPDEIVFIWDGPNGSQKRKAINKNYKAGRKPIRLNRSVKNLTEDEELRNKVWQQMRLMEYLNEMPIIQIIIPEVEADDVIAHLTHLSHYKGWQKVIISNDQEYCENTGSKLKFHKNIIEGQEIIAHNYKMMQLYSPMLSVQSKDFVQNAVENFECVFNKIEIMKNMRDDGFGELNWKDLELHLNKINSEA